MGSFEVLMLLLEWEDLLGIPRLGKGSVCCEIICFSLSNKEMSYF